MSIGEQILNKMLKEGANIRPEKRPGVVREIEKAIENKQFVFVEREGKDIGFLAYSKKPDGIFVHNLVIYKPERTHANLVYLRKFFRQRAEGLKIYWNSKKRGAKLCTVK